MKTIFFSLFVSFTCCLACAFAQTPAAAPAATAPAAAAPAPTPAPVSAPAAPGQPAAESTHREQVKTMLLNRSSQGVVVQATPVEVRQGANDALAELTIIPGFAGDILTTRAAARAAMPVSDAAKDAARMADEAILTGWTSRITGVEARLWAYAPAAEQAAKAGKPAEVEQTLVLWHEDEKTLDSLENPGFFGTLWWWWNR